MKKHINILCVVSALVLSTTLILSGCGENESSSSATADTAGTAVASSFADTVLSTDAPLPSGGTEFKIGSDDQNGFWSRCDMILSNGSGDYPYYESEICYFDYATQSVMPLCSKPDCEHKFDNTGNGGDCNAYFDSSEFLLDKGLAYYDDNIYMLGLSQAFSSDDLYNNGASTGISLYRVSKDGSQREEVCALFNTTDVNTIRVFTIHRGYAFWSICADDGCGLYSMKLDDIGSVTTVFSSGTAAAQVNTVIGAGDSLYFMFKTPLDDEYNEWDKCICRYDLGGDKVYSLLNASGTFAVANNKMYYIDEKDKSKSVYECTLDGKNSKKLCDCDSNVIYVYADANYIFLSNYGSAYSSDGNIDDSAAANYTIDVFDLDGKEVDEISIANAEVFCGHSNDYFYISSGGSIRVLGKEQIGSADKEWKKLYSIDDNGNLTFD